MNTLRRSLLVIYSLLLLAAAAGVGMLAWNQDDQLDLTVQDLNVQALVTADDAEKYLLTAILGVIAFVALVTFIVAVWPHRTRSRGALRLKQADGGTVEVTAAAIESLIRDDLEALPEVQSAKPRVSLASGAVDTYLDVQIEPSTSIAHATKLLSSTVETVLREQVGVTAIRRPTIRVTYDEMAARPIGGRRERTMPPPPSELRPQHQGAFAGEPSVARPADTPRYSSSEEDSPTT